MKTFTFKYEPGGKKALKKELLKATKTKTRPEKGVLAVSDLKSLLAVATENRILIFNTIVAEAPSSLYELAKLIGKDQAYTLREVKVLEGFGLIQLKEDNSSAKPKKIPQALYDRIVIDCGEPSKRSVS